MTRNDVSVTKQFPSGAWEVSAIVRGFRMVRVFYGYPKREAIRRFLAEAQQSAQLRSWGVPAQKRA